MRFSRKSGPRTSPVNRDGHAIGLDLGATAVRAAILTVSSKSGRPTVTIHGRGAVPLPPGAIVNGGVNDQAAVTRALKQLWEQHHFTSRKVILGVAHQQIVVRPLQIPNLTPQQRALALPFQAKELIALPMEEVILDYVQVGEPDSATGMLSGLLIATPRRPVLAAVAAVERAGLKVARVDLSSFAALRSIADEHLQVQAVIDLGAQLTSIVIHNNGVPQLVRTLARGGQEVTEKLVEALDLSFDDAERAKRETGLAAGSASAADAVNRAIRPLLAEIRSSINYYRAGSEVAPLERISLTGGAAALPGLAEALSSQNGVPTSVVSPMQHVANRPSEEDTSIFAAEPREPAMGTTAVALGLAIGAAA